MESRPDCDRFEAAISAGIDGEDPGVDPALVAAHLARCEHCRRFAELAAAQHGRIRVQAAEPTPDLRARILDAIPTGTAPRPRWRPRRAALPVLLAGAAAVVVVALVGGYLLGDLIRGGSSGNGAEISQVAGSNQTNAAFPGATVYPPGAVTPKPSITLTDTAGQPYNLSQATRGRVTLVYFGYTNCPDVCPINMALTAQALRGLPAAQRKDVTVVFITTDPKRDTRSAIRAWLSHFDSGLPAFVGLRGSLDQIHQAERQVHMLLSYAETVSASSRPYSVVHAGYTLVYSQDGRAHMQVDDTETPSEYTTTLEHLLAADQGGHR